MPAVVDAVAQRGEILTAYTPYQPEMSQGTLQAIFEYQTAICELTGMDVSNASGYDGTTVAADACLIARQATGRKKVVVTETLNPQVREVVRTFASGFGMEVVEIPHTGGVTDPAAVADAATDAACVIFPQPNFFGCLEPVAELAAAANDAGAVSVAHVDLMTLGLLEAPGEYGCQIAVGEGQSAGNPLAYGGPHYGFVASKMDHVRRLPGRIVGQTVDTVGRRGYVLTLQTREQHIRREKATSNITTNQTCWRCVGSSTCRGSARPACATSVRRACRCRSTPRRTIGLEPVFDHPTVKEFAVRTNRPASEVVAAARKLGVHPGYAVGAEYPGMDARAAGGGHRAAHARGHRPAGAGAGRGRPHEADLRALAGGSPGVLDRRIPTSPRRSSRPSTPAPARRGWRSWPSPSWCGISPSSRPVPSASTPASIRSARAP